MTAPSAHANAAARAPAAEPDPEYVMRQLALFDASVLKAAKWRNLEAAIGDTTGRDALDLGSDNGVISALLRRRGGRWTSADLTSRTVDAIRRMVGERVHLLRGSDLPFDDAAFDLVVVVDLLEHVSDDRRLLAEIGRVLRPRGRAVVNVPHVPRDRTMPRLLPRIRHTLGLTDAWHGHLRPGYDVDGMRALLPPCLTVVAAREYSKSFSHALDTALNWAYRTRAGARATSDAKGMVVTADDVGGGASALRRLRGPMRAFAAGDALLPWAAGYALLVTLERIDG